MSSLVRSSSGTRNESLKIQIKKVSPICKTTKDQLFSKSPQQESTVFYQHELEEYRFMVLELLASWLSFSCLVLGKKITLFCCDCFSKPTSESSHPSPPLSNSTDSESPQILDFDTENYAVSLLNLDVEDSELIENFDHLEFDDHLDQSNFPSPLSTNSSESQSEIVLEVSEFEDLNTELEPLFWPLEKFSWNSQETWPCFTMSPRKGDQTCQSSCDTFELKVNERERPVFTLGSEASRIMERRFRNKASSTITVPSRLSISSKIGMEIPKLETPENEMVEDSRLTEELFPFNLPCDHLDSLLEEEFKQEELSIELLLGLGEFDGHEGVDIEFNQYDFSLDDSLS